jgi:hypothetical protein
MTDLPRVVGGRASLPDDRYGGIRTQLVENRLSGVAPPLEKTAKWE